MAQREILVVEGDKEVMQGLTALLRQYGYLALWAQDVTPARDVLDARDVAAVLCEYQLPSGNGFDVLRAIRSHPKHSRLPFLLMTTTPSLDVVKEARELGVSDFIVKPVDPARLVKALALTLSGYSITAKHLKTKATDRPQGQK